MSSLIAQAWFESAEYDNLKCNRKIWIYQTFYSVRVLGHCFCLRRLWTASDVTYEWNSSCQYCVTYNVISTFQISAKKQTGFFNTLIILLDVFVKSTPSIIGHIDIATLSSDHCSLIKSMLLEHISYCEVAELVNLNHAYSIVHSESQLVCWL